MKVKEKVMLLSQGKKLDRPRVSISFRLEFKA